jgi:serine/threonine protein phosphatase PrpC
MNGKNCGVIAEPDTYFQDLIFSEDGPMHPEYLVLASDGVWDFLKAQQIR